MKITDCQKDYFTNTILVHYLGDKYNEKELMEHVKKVYPNQSSYVVIDHQLPSMYKGFQNLGSVTIKVK